MRATSIDLRKRVVAACILDGQHMGQIAEHFRISKGAVQNILERYRDSGSLVPKPQNAGRKPAFSEQSLRGKDGEGRLQPLLEALFCAQSPPVITGTPEDARPLRGLKTGGLDYDSSTPLASPHGALPKIAAGQTQNAGFLSPAPRSTEDLSFP